MPSGPPRGGISPDFILRLNISRSSGDIFSCGTSIKIIEGATVITRLATPVQFAVECVSSFVWNTQPIVKYVKEQGKKILWALDRHLGSDIQGQTGADMLLWPIQRMLDFAREINLPMRGIGNA